MYDGLIVKMVGTNNKCGGLESKSMSQHGVVKQDKCANFKFVEDYLNKLV